MTMVPNTAPRNRPQARRAVQRLLGPGAFVWTSYEWMRGEYMLCARDAVGRVFSGKGASWTEAFLALRKAVHETVRDASDVPAGAGLNHGGAK